MRAELLSRDLRLPCAVCHITGLRCCGVAVVLQGPGVVSQSRAVVLQGCLQAACLRMYLLPVALLCSDWRF
jgi:hypothetical protein